MSQDRFEEGRNQRSAPAGRAVLWARLAIFVERASPMVVVAGAPISLLIAASLFDGWSLTPRWAHAIAIIAALLLSARLGYARWRNDMFPSRGEALARLEKDGGVRHDALRALEDAPLSGGGPLWDAHRAEMKRLGAGARLRGPRVTSNGVDPFGARYAVFALLVVGWIAAGGEAGSRLIAGFLPADPRAGAAGFADLWIEPPAYTGKAPIYLVRAKDALPGTRSAVAAPEGSIVYAQVNATSRFRLMLKTRDGAIVGAREGPEKSARTSLKLEKSGMLALGAGGRVGRWPIEVIDDRAPSVMFVEPPAPDRDGRVAIATTIDDDYGVVRAELVMQLDPDQERPLDAPPISVAVKAERRTIAIDGMAGAGARAAAIDLQSDPWAGLAVTATLIVTDAAGQSAQTAAVAFTLPAKQFHDPLARTVIEQRQTLAVAPDEWRRAEWALNGVTLGPELFFEDASDYLLLRSAMWRVNKQKENGNAETVDAFWPLALQLEDESLELARRRLEAARDALRNALQSGADASEIERLTEEMRAALQQYLEAMAQSGEAPPEGEGRADQTVSADDLNAMLDSIRDLSKSGAEGAARQALAELENILQNLRLPGRQAGDQGQSGEGAQGGAAGAAGDLIGRERSLADKSFERGQTRGAAGDDLASEQRGIAADLSALMQSLEGEGAENGAAHALGQALDAMRQSEEALNGEDFDAANDAMERAIANLREGAEKLSRAGRPAGAHPGARAGGQPMRDPLGRPLGQYGEGVEVPEKSDAQRTRELIEELRRRLSDGERTEEEIDYLERLLERF